MAINLQQYGFVSGLQLEDFQANVVDRAWESLIKYNEAGMELFTHAGKTMIGATIAARYLAEHPNSFVLWIGPSSANDNVAGDLKLKLVPAINNKIKFISYNLLARRTSDPTTIKGAIGAGLIIMDECQSALAKQTKKSIMNILSKNFRAAKVVMTATKDRHTDNVDSIKALVPTAYNNKAIISMNLAFAISNNLINDLCYVVVANNFARVDMQIVKRYKEAAYAFSDTRKMYDELIQMMKEYNNDSVDKIYEALKRHLGLANRSANDKSGERHVVFYSSIKDLENETPKLERAFTKLYPGFKIRVHNYTSANADSIDILINYVHKVPTDGVIDIIATVNKGEKSIHPKGIKSVIMFRTTYSDAVFTQQIGRAVSLRALASGQTYVFDFSDTINCLSLGYAGKSIYSESSTIKTKMPVGFDLIYERLANKLGKDIIISSIDATEDMIRCINKFDYIAKLKRNRKCALDLINLKKKYKNHKYIRDYPSVSRVMQEYYKDPNKPKLESSEEDIIKWSDIMYATLLNTTVADSSIIDKNEILALGHTPFLHSLDFDTSKEELLRFVDAIKTEQGYGHSYDEMSKANKEKYSKLYNQQTTGKLPTTVVAYMRLLGVSLDDTGKKNNILKWKSKLNQSEYEQLKDFRNRLRKLTEMANQNNRYKAWCVIKASIYASNLSRLAAPFAESADEFKEALKEFNHTITISEDDISTITQIAHKLKHERSDFMGAFQLNLLKHRCNFDNYTDIEKAIIMYYGFDKDTFNKQVLKRLSIIKKIKRYIDMGTTQSVQMAVNECIMTKTDFMIEYAHRIAADFPGVKV